MRKRHRDDTWWQAETGTSQPACFTSVKKQKTIQQKTNGKSFFLNLAGVFFWFQCMMTLKTITKWHLNSNWTKPRCKHTLSKAKGRLKLSELSHVVSPSANRFISHQSVVESSVNYFSFCILNLLLFPAVTCDPCLQNSSTCGQNKSQTSSCPNSLQKII